MTDALDARTPEGRIAQARTLATQSRSDKRDRERTWRVVQAALKRTRGNHAMAGTALREQAAEAARGAAVAIRKGAGDETALQLLDRAARRLRAAIEVDGKGPSQPVDPA